MRKNSMISSQGSPKKVMSQISVQGTFSFELDCINVDLINKNYEKDNLGEMLTESLNISRYLCKLIVHKASNIIYEKYILSQLTPHGSTWVINFSNSIIRDFNSDDNIITQLDENEPQPCPFEHWRRMIGEVHSPKQSIIQNRVERLESKFQYQENMQLKLHHNNDSQIIKTGLLDDELDLDAEIESLRQAKIRQLNNLQQKQMLDIIKKQENIEQNRQLKRLNVDSKSKYTYDFEGKVIVQKVPDIERYPKTQWNMQEKRQLLEVKDLFPNQKKKIESIYNNRKKNIENNNQTLNPKIENDSLIDIIQLRQGVSYLEGQNQKRNERHLSLLDIQDPKDLQKTLSLASLKMSKIEYSAVTNTNLALIKSNKTSIKSTSVVNIQQAQQQSQQQIADFSMQSLNTSIAQKLNGTISVISDHIDDLLVKEYYSIQLTAKLPKISNVQKSQEIPKHMLTEPSPIPLQNSLTKLPLKKYNLEGTFSKHIPKYPRERLSKIAQFYKQ